MDVSPAADNSLAVVILNQAESGVAELDECYTRLFAESVLHVVGDRVDMKSGPTTQAMPAA